ncbi:MAG: MlaE family lipid ABC transporter permease subunit [Myxococcales bacterium]|nr:MlaE family lipid ABC transporter permease subunit [Myxococcales bacterium]
MGSGATTLDTADGPAFAVALSEGALHLTGDFRMDEAPAIWRELHRSTEGARGGSLTVDLSGTHAIDGAVMALIVALRTELAARGVRTDIQGTPSHLRSLVELYGVEAPPEKRKKREPESAIAQVGRATVRMGEGLEGVIAFLGELVVSGRALARSPRKGHLKEVPPLVERAGADAVPIVVVINFLVGFVMAYQASSQASGELAVFGAALYIADLVGLTVTRELAPLMTAIIVCGRSGAAFAAEIGSMKISGELDALRTFGLRPFAWLVVPRVLALVLIVPALTLVADVVGVLGGLCAGVASLGLSVKGYFIETREAVGLWDVGQGVIKSVVFAIAIALIACQQGFSVSGGAEGVGKRTTSTVVMSLFALVVLDAIFTIILQEFGR